MQWSGNTETASQNPGGGQSNGYASLSVAGGVDVTPGYSTYKNRVIEVTGVITASFNVILPSTPQGAMWVIKNSTTGNFQLTFKTAGGTGVIVAQGKTAVIWTDGTNFYPWPNDADAQGFRPSNKVDITLADSNQTLTFAQALGDHLECSGALTGTRDVKLPSNNFKKFSVHNGTAQSIVVKSNTGTGITVTTGKYQELMCDGTNVVARAAAI